MPVEFWKWAAQWGVWIGLGLTIGGAGFGALAGMAGLELGKEADHAIANAKAAAEQGRALAEAAGAEAANAKLAASLADERAAAANERATANELKAEELRVALANTRAAVAARELTGEQRKILIDGLRGKYETILVRWRAGDLDASFYAHEWMGVIGAAGIRPVGQEMNWGVSVQGQPVGVTLAFPKKSTLEIGTEPLYQAVNAAGLFGGAYSDMPGTEMQVDVPTIDIPSRSAPRLKAIEEGFKPPPKSNWPFDEDESHG